MEPPSIKQKLLRSPQLPLAVYREIVAHLHQVVGVNASLIMRSLEHDPSETFDYYKSQVAALQIDFTQDLTELGCQQVEAILDYYAQRYHPWETKIVEHKESLA